MAVFQGFIGPSYSDQNPITDPEDLYNWYLERSESPGATAPQSYIPTPGAASFATSIAVGCRGNFTDDQTGRSFSVQGGSFVELSAGGVVTVRGAVAVDGNPATISTNGVGGGQLLITSGSNAYSYDLATDTLTLEVAGEATQGAVLYGFGLIFDKVTGNVRLSDLFDLTTWDPTQFFARSINTDPWQAMHVTPYGYIVLPGTQTGENWYNAGTSPIPFAPDPSGNFGYGIAATFSIQQCRDAVIWLSSGIEGDFQVVKMSGFTPDRISTHPLEFALAGYNDAMGLSDAIGQVHGEHGHTFYCLHFPRSKATWAWDRLTQQWAKRATWISETSSWTYWRPMFHTFAFGKQLMGDPETNVIYELDHSTGTDVDGRVIRRLRKSPLVQNENKRIVVDTFELLMQVGIGIVTGQGSDPIVMLRVSRDGGFTWGNQQSLHAGQMGEYWRRVIKYNAGMGRKFVFEVSVTDPVPFRITSALIQVRPTTELRAA